MDDAGAHAQGDSVLAAAATPLPHAINLAVLDPRASFDALDARDQLRIYHLYRAVCETHKIAFLQSSVETPGILLFIRELFCPQLSEDVALQPADAVRELQKSCQSKGLSDAATQLLVYVTRFLYNFGTYDLGTGAKIVPALSRREFKDVVQSSHAFTHSRSSGRLQSLLESTLEAIYSHSDRAPAPVGSAAVTGVSARDTNTNTTNTDGERMADALVYPFYKGLTLQDALLVDKTLREHRISTCNTRIEGHGDARAKSFTVYRAVAVDTDTETSPLPRVLQMPDRRHMRLVSGDYEPALSHMLQAIRTADRLTPSYKPHRASDDTSDANSSTQSGAAFFATGDVHAHHTMVHQWTQQQVSAAEPVAFVVRVCALPRERDPLHARGAIESFVAIRNPSHQAHTELLLTHHISALVQLLPFSHLMNTQAAQTYTQTGAQHTSTGDPRRYKLLFLANCTERYATGLATSAKLVVLDAFVSASVLESVRAERHSVAYFAFVCEDVLAPGTLAFLQELEHEGEGSRFTLERADVVWLPPAFAIPSSSNDNDSSEEKQTQQRRWRRHSSFGKRAERWYAPRESYATTFAPAVATALESTYRFAIAYWASALRTAVFALAFYSKTQRRWDDAHMQAHFMVLHMLLYNDDSAREDAELQQPHASTVSGDTAASTDPVELLVTLANARRGSTGTPQQPGVATSVRLHFPVLDECTWLEHAKLRTRAWLQQIQWIQITGDTDAGGELYRAHSSVSNRFLQCQDFVLSKFSSESTDVKASSLLSSAPAKSLTSSSKSSSETAPSIENVLAARSSASALQNASSFGLETLWIPPVLELRLPDAPVPGNDEDHQSAAGSKSQVVAEETAQDSAASELGPLSRVAMRVLEPDLASAIEAAVLAL